MGASPLSATFFPFTGSSNSLTITIPSSVPDFIPNCEHLHSTVSAAAVELWTFAHNCVHRGRCWIVNICTQLLGSHSANTARQLRSWSKGTAHLRISIRLLCCTNTQLRYMYRWEIHLRYTVEKYIKELVSAPICFSGNTVETTAEHKVENTVEI